MVSLHFDLLKLGVGQSALGTQPFLLSLELEESLGSQLNEFVSEQLLGLYVKILLGDERFEVANLELLPGLLQLGLPLLVLLSTALRLSLFKDHSFPCFH
jgi:hypothetical protein